MCVCCADAVEGAMPPRNDGTHPLRRAGEYRREASSNRKVFEEWLSCMIFFRREAQEKIQHLSASLVTLTEELASARSLIDDQQRESESLRDQLEYEREFRITSQERCATLQTSFDRLRYFFFLHSRNSQLAEVSSNITVRRWTGR